MNTTKKNFMFANLKTVSLIAICLISFAACGDDDIPGPKEPTDPENPENPTDPEKPGNDEKLTPESWYETNYWERTDREKSGLRGKVKSWHFNSSYHTVYEYDDAGHLIFARSIDPNSKFPEWCTWYTYDSKGRLIKKVYGRVTQKGGNEIDNWSTIETTEYEYNNGDKYVWVDPYNFDSRTFVNYLGPEHREPLDDIRKGLSKRIVSSALHNMGSYSTYDYNFNEAGQLVVSYTSYTTDEEGNREEDSDIKYSFNPITYNGQYPYSGAIDENNTITSIEWRANGMPLKVDGASGLTEYSASENRYINPLKWTCKEGKPIDAFFGFTFAREWSYDNNTGELTELLERENENSDRPWTRPTKWTYKYDSYGNWTSYNEEYMILIDGPDGTVNTSSLSRTIEYY